MLFSRAAVMALLAAGGVLLGGCGSPDTYDSSDPFGVLVTPTWKLQAFRVRDDRPPPITTVKLPDEPLTLQQCIDLALNNSPRIRQSRQSVFSTKAIIGQTKGLWWPIIQLQGARERTKSQFGDGDELRGHEWKTVVSMDWTLADFGIRRASLASAEARLRASGQMHKSTLLDIMLAAELSYYRLLESQAYLDVLQTTVEQRTAHVDMARKRVNAGVVPLADLRQAEAERDEAKAALIEGESQVDTASGLLASIMGVRPSIPIRVQPIPDEVTEVSLAHVDKLLTEAGAERPRLKAAAAEITRMKVELLRQKASRLPSLSMSGAYGLVEGHALPDAGYNEWSLGLILTMELFTGFQRTYAIRQVESEVKSAEYNYEALLREVENEVWEAYSTARHSFESIKAADSFVVSARESLKLNRREYDQGRVSFVALVDVQQTYARALFLRARSRLRYYMAIARLQRARGNGIDRIPLHLAE